jgi:hypothetical protein
VWTRPSPRSLANEASTVFGEAVIDSARSLWVIHRIVTLPSVSWHPPNRSAQDNAPDPSAVDRRRTGRNAADRAPDRVSRCHTGSCVDNHAEQF